MQIKQIGNGGAFNFKETNSSFLIKNKEMLEDLILFDCGHSVYQKLRELDESEEISLKDLKAVYISHFDDDHIGSLKTLIYYQYFINKIKLDILVASELEDEMELFLRDLDGYYEDFQKVYDELYNIVVIYDEDTKYKELVLTKIHCIHHIPCFGLTIYSRETNRCFIITGDTKAIPALDEYYFHLRDELEIDVLVFHDLSFWDCPEKQVHMCRTDMYSNYSVEFIKELNFYHNDDIDYYKGWI